MFARLLASTISSNTSGDEIDKSMFNSSADLKSSPSGVSQAIIGALIPLFLNSIASSNNAVPSQSAPD